MQAKNYFQKQQANFQHPEFGRKEFSWGLGGPIRKDKTFFFVSGDVLRSDVAVSGPRSILTPQFIQFMQQARPNNISTRDRPRLPRLVHPRPRTSAPRASSWARAARAPRLIDSPIGPVALQPPGDGRRDLERDLAPQRLPVDGPRRPPLQRRARTASTRPSTARPRTRSASATARGLSRASPSNVADQQPAAQHELDEDPLLEPRERDAVLVGAALRRAGQPPRRHPRHHASAGSPGYQVGWGPNIFVQNSFNWSDVVTWTRGAHSMKFGAGYTREHADNDSARAITRPTFNFDSVFDFAADRPSSESQIAIDPRTGARARPRSSASIARSRSPRSCRTSGRSSPNLTLSARAALRGLPQHLRRLRRHHDQHRVPATQTGNLRNDLATARMVRAQVLPGRRPLGRRPAHARPAPELRLGSDRTRADVDPRRRRPLLRAHVQPDLGLRAPEPARLRQRVGEHLPARAAARSPSAPSAARRPTTIRTPRASPPASTSTAAC